MKFSKETSQWLRDYIEGEISSLPNEVRRELLSKAEKRSIEVFRGNYFESKESAQERYGKEDLKFFTYLVNSPKSFTTSLEVAELFAQDINSNYGIVIRLTIEVPFIDLSKLDESLTEDFDHESEILVLEDCEVVAEVIKEFSNTKNNLGIR